MKSGVRIEGMEPLLHKLHNLENLQQVRPALMAGALHIKGKIAKYPPHSIANSPGNPTGKWYERGYGPRWSRKDGSMGGRKTSETLGRKWTTAERNAGLTQVLGNNASYAPYVHDAEEQAGFHGDRGWLTDEEVLRNEGDKVLQFIQK